MDNLKMTFHFMEGSNPIAYNHLASLVSPVAKLEYVTSKSPYASEWIDTDTLETFWRPKMGDVHVSITQDFKRYPTAAGAYKEAVRIKALMMKKIGLLKSAYRNRDKNHRIIREHYPIRKGQLV